MVDFVVGSELTNAIRNVIATGKADLAVAFWGKGASKTLGFPKDMSNIRIACDARSGACNPAEIEKLIKRNAKIVDVSNLHAKVYLGDNAMVVCSANASANGLGEESKELDTKLEAGFCISKPDELKVAQGWFNELFAGGRQVTLRDIDELRTLSRRAQRPSRMAGSKLIDILRNNKIYFKDRKFKVVIYSSDEKIKERYKEIYEALGHEENDDHSFYYDIQLNWNVEINDYLIDIYEYNGIYKCYGVWTPIQFFDNKTGMIATLVRKPFGLKFGSRDWPVIGRFGKSLISSNQVLKDGPAKNVCEIDWDGL